MPPVIGIDTGSIGSGGLIEAYIERFGQSKAGSIFYQMKSFLEDSFPFFDNSRSNIGGAIIDTDNFEVLKNLFLQTFKTSIQRQCSIVDRDEDGNFG
jgi:hypothetical protein